MTVTLITGDAVPCTVLDPFAGVGTTLLVADRLGRRGEGIELNPDYVKIAHARLAQDPQARAAKLERAQVSMGEGIEAQPEGGLDA